MTISVLSGLFVLLFGALNWRLWKTCFTPWFLMVVAQVGGISVYYLGLHPLATELKPTTWLMLSAFLFAFILGCIMASKVAPQAESRSHSPDQLPFLSQIFPILLFLTLLGTFSGYIQAGGWPMFLNDKDGARMAFARMPWYGSYSFQAVTALGHIGALLLFQKSLVKRFMGGLGIALLVWISLIVGMRGYLIFFLVLFLATWDAKIRSISPVKLMIAAVVTLSGFISIFFIRFHLLAFSKLAESMTIQKKAYILFQPLYVYIANNFWNLDSALDRLNTSQALISSPGYWTLGGFFFFTNIPGTLNIAYGFGTQFALLLKVENLNTMPVEWNYFADWGWIGLLFLALAHGFFASYFFYRRKQSDFHLLMHSIFALSCALSFFANVFNLPNVALFLVVAFFLKGATILMNQRTIQAQL